MARRYFRGTRLLNGTTDPVTQKMILTILEAHVEAGQEPALQSAYAAAIASSTRPPGLVRSQLIRDAFDPGRWRIQTWWESRQALEAMRGTGTPAGILMFRAAGAEPATSIFEVVDELRPMNQ